MSIKRFHEQMTRVQGMRAALGAVMDICEAVEADPDLFLFYPNQYLVDELSLCPIEVKLGRDSSIAEEAVSGYVDTLIRLSNEEDEEPYISKVAQLLLDLPNTRKRVPTPKGGEQ